MNRHKEKLNSILSRQKDYQRKGKCMLGNGKFSRKCYVILLRELWTYSTQVLTVSCIYTGRFMAQTVTNNAYRQTFWRKKTKSK